MTIEPSGISSLLDRVPRSPRENLLLRGTVLDGGRRHAGLWRAVCTARGPEACLLWLNLFGWTFNPRTAAKHHPFVTWPVQDRAVRELWDAVDAGHDVLIDKSRDMGATWLNVAVLVWWWLFVPDTPLLMASRKEEYVDARGNPDTLFWKADYLVNHLPSWLTPRLERRHLHLGNLDNGSVLDGESTNGDLGRGGRRKAILLDEFAAVENGCEILAATADAAPCRIFNSTPKGRGNAFADVRFSGKVRVITLHWREHPEKGAGARQVEALGTGHWALGGRHSTTGDRHLGAESDPDANCQLPSTKCLPRWTSPWYEAECARRTSRKEIAQELDIDYLASGEAFFDLDVLQRLRAGGDLVPPTAAGELAFDVDTRQAVESYRVQGIRWRPDAGRRRLSVWCELPDAPAGSVCPVGARPRQDRTYVAFADIGQGVGASNSVLKFARVEDRRVVGQLVCCDSPPADFAEMCVAACLWFGGLTARPLLGWEANGPGGVFGRRVFALGYRPVLGNTNPRIPWHPSDDRIGWYSTREKKEDLLGELRAAWARGELVEHDLATIVEAEQYVYYPAGGVGPGGRSEVVEPARQPHGDRVIAAAGMLLCLRQSAPPDQPADPPPQSFAQRRLEHLKEKNDREQW